MGVTAVEALLDHFAAEDLAPEGAGSLRERARAAGADARTVLAALLTVRPPGPVPPAVLAILDDLLHEEARARGAIEAAQLPVLAVTHPGVVGVLADRVALWQGDLVRLRADAVVNAANDAMLGCFVPGHRCIDNALHAAAGPSLRAECAAHMASQGHPEPTGSATLTAGYALPARYVVHTVGPIVRGALTAAHAEALRSSYLSVLDVAQDHGDVVTVGFCAVSTGVFGYPKADAARVVFDALEEWFTEHPESRLRAVVSAFTPADLAVYSDELRERASGTAAQVGEGR